MKIGQNLAKMSTRV